jgi:hypothetical protein
VCGLVGTKQKQKIAVKQLVQKKCIIRLKCAKSLGANFFLFALGTFLTAKKLET